MFAEDTNLLFESNLLNIYALNDVLNQTESWLAENKLRFNSSKTQLKTFSYKSLNVALSGKNFHQYDCVKYLGFYFH